jgi:hypothetical protein
VSCGRADVDALISCWDRMGEGWRRSVAAACKQLSAAASSLGVYDASPAFKLQASKPCNVILMGQGQTLQNESGKAFVVF